MRRTIPIIALVGALISLGTSIVAWNTSCINAKNTASQGKQLAIQEMEMASNAKQLVNQEKELAEHQKALDALKINTTKVFRSLTIEVPNKDAKISDAVYDKMRGTFTGEIPEDYHLWVLAKDSFNFFLVSPQTQFTRTMHQWSQTNIRLNTPGQWELHVCLANKKACDWFQNRVNTNDFSGFAKLPDGAETVNIVVVEKK